MADRRRVMVTGAAVRAGGTSDLDAFDALLRAGQPRAGEPAGDWDAWLANLTRHAPDMAARARRVGRTAGAALRATLQVAVEATLTAGASVMARPESLGVVVAGSNMMLGRAFQAHGKFQAEPAFLSPRHGYEFYDTHVMACIAEVIGARGPGMTVGGASGSGNVAIGVGLDLIRHGRSDACLVVGPLADLSPVEWHALRAMGALGRDGHPCRPFDRAAHGFVFGSACGAVVLEGADRGGAPPMAELAGACWVQGGNHLPSPDVDGEVRAMTGALADAGIDAGDLDLISAHATGTPAGDAAECEAIRLVLGDHHGLVNAGEYRVAVNAPKSLFGHALHAAGVVELIALVRQMQGGFVHGTAGLTEPIADDPWLVGPAAIERPVRIGLSNSFGFGGIAASVVVVCAGDVVVVCAGDVVARRAGDVVARRAGDVVARRAGDVMASQPEVGR